MLYKLVITAASNFTHFPSDFRSHCRKPRPYGEAMCWRTNTLQLKPQPYPSWQPPLSLSYTGKESYIPTDSSLWTTTAANDTIWSRETTLLSPVYLQNFEWQKNGCFYSKATKFGVIYYTAKDNQSVHYL